MSTLQVGRMPLRVLANLAETPEVSVRRRDARSSDRTPIFGRKDAMSLAVRVMEAPDLISACKEIARVSRRLPQQAGSNLNWRGHLRRMAHRLAMGENELSIFGMEGNSKMPHVTFSTLPVVTCPGAGECVNFCYSLGSWQYAATYARQMQNTLLMRFMPEVIADKFQDLPYGRRVRLYVDGDFDSEASFAFWMGEIRRRPDLQVYGYSKSWDIIAEYARKYPDAVPANYALNLSSGGAPQLVSKANMLALPFVRGEFITVKADYSQHKPGGLTWTRFDDPDYHDCVERAAKAITSEEVASCPGNCGDCHACGDMALRGVVIAIGLH